MLTALLPRSLHGNNRLIHSKVVSPARRANVDVQKQWLIAESIFKGMMQVTMKYAQQVLSFDGISSATQCGHLLSQLELRLGAKIPGNAQLVHNGRFLKTNDTIEEVCAACAKRFFCQEKFFFLRSHVFLRSGRFNWTPSSGSHLHETRRCQKLFPLLAFMVACAGAQQSLLLTVHSSSGMNCLWSCFRPNSSTEPENSRLRGMDGESALLFHIFPTFFFDYEAQEQHRAPR